MDNATFHQLETIMATVRNVIIDLADACEVLYQKGYTMAYTQAKRDDIATLRAFNAALLAGEYDSPAINSGIDVLVIRGVSDAFMQDVYSFLGLETPENSVEWNDDLSLADNIKANIRVQEKTPEPYVQGIICNDIIPAKENDTMNDTIQRLLALRSKCTTDELCSLNKIILEVDGQLNMNMAAYSYHANNIAHLLCAEDRFSLVPSHVEHHSALCDDTGDFDDMGMESYADQYHSAQKYKYGLL